MGGGLSSQNTERAATPAAQASLSQRCAERQQLSLARSSAGPHIGDVIPSRRTPQTVSSPPRPAPETAGGGPEAPRTGGRRALKQPLYTPAQGPPGPITLLSAIGSGACGVVCEAVAERTNTLLCVKTVDASSDAALWAMEREVALHQRLRHPNVAACFGVEGDGARRHVLLELVRGVTLERLVALCGPLPEPRAAATTHALLSALAFLAAMGVAHNDVKGANVMVNYDGHTKLIDFGCAAVAADAGDRPPPLAGTPYWMAPEVVRQEAAGAGQFGAADVWALGCTVVEMLTGRPPLAHLDPMAALFAIGKGTVDVVGGLPASVSRGCRAFLQRCLCNDPRQRATAQALLADEWVVRATDAAWRPDEEGLRQSILEALHVEQPRDPPAPAPARPRSPLRYWPQQPSDALDDTALRLRMAQPRGLRGLHDKSMQEGQGGSLVTEDK